MVGTLLRMFAVALVLACASSHVRALELAEPVWALDCMHGLTAVHVAVRPISSYASRAGLDRGALEERVSARLRAAGLELVGDRPVVPPDAPETAGPEWALLRVNLDDVRRDPNEDGYHEYWLQLELMQDAQLVHHPAVRLPIQTWSRESTGSHRESQVAAAVTAALDQSLDELLRDHASVNPPVPPAQLNADAGEKEPEGD